MTNRHRALSGQGRIAARAAWGAALLLAPSQLLRVVGAAPSPGWCTVVRVLGARHLVQSAIEHHLAPRRPRVLRVVDGAHAASALGFAMLDRRRARLGVIDGIVASAFALA